MVKKIIRVFVIETVSLYLTSQAISGLVFAKGFQSIIAAGFALALASLLVKPILNIFLLPLNLVTFNLFRWVNHAVMLFLVDLALVDFTVTHFAFAGFSSDYFDLPALTLEPGPLTYLGFSVIIALIANLIHWILDK